MSWRDRFLDGSLNDVPFVVESDEMEFGRRTVVHEYPGRNDPFAEDLGRATRKFTTEIFVVGTDYDLQRDRLIAEIEKPGPKKLVHPYLGTMQIAIVAPCRKRESTREGGMCRFTLEFIEAGDKVFPSAVTDTTAAVEEAADETLAQVIDEFAQKFSVLKQAGDFVHSIEDELDNTLAAVEATVGAVINPIAALIRAPANMASATVDSVRAIADKVGEPKRALDIYRSLFRVGSPTSGIPTTTANRRVQVTNLDQVQRLVQRSAIVEACRAAGSIDYASSAEALAMRDELVDEIDAQMESLDPITGSAIGDELFNALQALRAAVARDLARRGVELPRLVTFTPPVTLSALYIAYQLYGDATRGDEIVARNRIRHPGFIPGGEAIEVLSDAP